MKRKVPLWLWQLWQYKRHFPLVPVTVAKTAQFYVSPHRMLRELGEGGEETSWATVVAAFERIKRSGHRL